MIEYTKYDGPLAYPGGCVCGSQKRPLVDTHRELPAFGHVYLCELCVRMSGRALGLWVEKPDHERVADELDRARAANDALQQQLDRALDPAGRTITAGELNAWLSSQQEPVG